MSEHFDVVTIGSGATSSTLAFKLAPAGKRIRILACSCHLAHEKQYWDMTEAFVNRRYVSKAAWYYQDNKPFQLGVRYFVGAATRLYGAASVRLCLDNHFPERLNLGMELAMSTHSGETIKRCVVPNDLHRAQ